MLSNQLFLQDDGAARLAGDPYLGLKSKPLDLWQIIPTALVEMLVHEDAEKSQRAMKAMLAMDKIDIERLKQAFEQQ